MIPQNYQGVQPQFQTQKDFVAGTIPYVEVLPSGNWREVPIVNERQYVNGVETSACVIFSLLNCVERQIKLQTKQEINFSDAFLAKLAGTDPKRGTALNVAAETLRLNGGALQADWNVSPNFTLDEFFRPLTLEIRQKAKQLLKSWDFAWEWVDISKASLEKQLKQAPIQIVISTCDNYNQTSVPVCALNNNGNHGVTLLDIENDKYIIQDHYEPFEKVLDPNYKIWYGLKMVVTPISDASVKKIYKMGQEYGLIEGATTERALARMLREASKPQFVLADGSVDWANLKADINVKQL